MTCTRIVGPGRTRTIMCSEVWDYAIPDPDCPNASEHSRHPTGYIQHHDWADRMLKTHNQKRCDGCGKFNIWVPK